MSSLVLCVGSGEIKALAGIFSVCNSAGEIGEVSKLLNAFRERWKSLIVGTEELGRGRLYSSARRDKGTSDDIARRAMVCITMSVRRTDGVSAKLRLSWRTLVDLFAEGYWTYFSSFGTDGA